MAMKATAIVLSLAAALATPSFARQGPHRPAQRNGQAVMPHAHATGPALRRTKVAIWPIYFYGCDDEPDMICDD